MDDLRYQVDMLTALNQKLISDNRMYELICNNSQGIFAYINMANDTVRVIGNISDYFECEIKKSSDIFKLIEYFKSEYYDKLNGLFNLDNSNSRHDSSEACLKDGKTWFLINVDVFYNNQNIATDKIITFQNFTKMHEKHDELTYLAYYDNLTNLYNRNYFITKLRSFVDKAEEENTIVSVMLIDIDDFRKISDSRGLIIGDEIIQNLGLYINSLTNKNIIASRFDSDLFCIAIYDPCEKRNVDTIYSSIKYYLKDPIRLTDGTYFSITVSVGVSEYPEATNNPLALINCAEVVLIKSKEKGKNMICYYDSEIINSFLHDVDIENKLKEAIHDNGLFMNYQPQYYSSTGKLRGVEALIRWCDKDGNIINPSEFIPISERNGSIIELGDFVLDTSIKKYMEWIKKYDYEFILSINISSIQYKRNDFVPKVLAVINKYGINPENIELEITESVLIEDLNSIVAKMFELKEYGIKVSLDDFGTGFSSLTYLKDLPIDSLKIDKSFIDNIVFDNSSTIITESIIQLSQKLGIVTIAEGVETKDQFDFLKNINCDIIQGFYLSKPLTPEKVDEILLRLI